jgi:competence protein ComEC
MRSKLVEFLLWLGLFWLFRISYEYRSSVVFLDVGQGDSSLISLNKEQILIDGGPSDTVLYKLPEYMPPWDMKIEYLILTHPHLDHISGLIYVLERYEVGAVYVNDTKYGSEVYDLFKAHVGGLSMAGGNQMVNLPISIWYPIGKDENVNNESLVTLLDYNGVRFLFTGDMEIEEEQKYIDDSGFKGIDVLKASLFKYIKFKGST